VLRRRRGSKCEFALPNQHQISNVNKRVREIRENSNRIASKNKVNAHEHATGNAPVPERDWNYAFALPLGGEPLDEETHREKSVPNEAEDHEITPIQSKKPVFFSDQVIAMSASVFIGNVVGSAFRLSLRKGR
jgi:hypothetical protein